MTLTIDSQRPFARPQMGLREGPYEPGASCPVGSEEAAAIIERFRKGKKPESWRETHHRKTRKKKTT